ncbi:MAG TPA: acetyl-CoA carboxylase carboxyltransferase subunit alpha/beta, partial [Pseudonocardiaceae bacterium]|nr:acetyl-CoA carboxylase carboxyltransferase subunit alpha/beta [Pseudonocardiaceae bacterium]
MTSPSAPAATTGTSSGGGSEKWGRCRSCDATVYLPRLVRALSVCPECGSHGRLGAAQRLGQVLDQDSFRPATDVVRSTDPLEFVDTEPYPVRLAKARKATGLDDAVLRGRGRIGGIEVVVAAMDFRFVGASMGSAVGEAVTRAAEESFDTGRPLVLFVASGGARMQEGCLSLMQMAKTTQALRRLGCRGIPSISVLTDPTFGGVTASFATVADFLIAEQGSLIGFAGPRVIEAATRIPLPPGFQTAEYLFERGMLDLVAPRNGLRRLLAQVLTLADPAQAPGRRPMPTANLVRDPDELVTTRSRWETLRVARDIARPTTLDYLHAMCDEFVELHGDRCHGDDRSIVGGPASIRGVRVMAIGHQKGHDTAELIANNFGMPHPEGYRKALRLMRLAERLRLPVVTFVDTQ